MKKYLVAGLMLALLSSCDDGDLVYEDLDFTGTAITPCSNNRILYKVNADQVFLIDLPDVLSVLPDSPNADTPVILQISSTSTNRVIYRHYDGTISGTDICATIQPSTPMVDDEWNATSGQIIIETGQVTALNTTEGFEGGEKITFLEHIVRLQNITFETGTGSQTYSNFPEDGSAFGIYNEPFAMPEIPAANSTLQYCDTDNENMVFVRNPSNLFSLKLSDALLDSTILNEVKSGYIDGTTNDLFFKNFPSGSLDLINPVPGGCTALFAAVPIQQWNGVYGVEADLTGRVEVTTTPDVSGYVKHNIHLKNVTLKFGTLEFLLATDYFFGEIILPI